MAKIYLPPMVGFCNPFEDVQYAPGTVVEIIPYRGYRYRHVQGGIFLYKTWWRRALDRLKGR